MVTGYLVSAGMAALTAGASLLVRRKVMRAEEGKKNAEKNGERDAGTGGKAKRGLAAAACLAGYLLLALLFEAYGYSLWKKERYLILLCAMYFLAAEDRRAHRIPNRWLLALCILRLILLAGEIFSWPGLWLEFLIHSFGGAFACLLLMLLAYFLSREKICLGDVKLLAVMGFYLGFALSYSVLLISLLLAAAWGIWNVWKKRVKMKDYIPFAPFLLAGLAAALGLGL